MLPSLFEQVPGSSQKWYRRRASEAMQIYESDQMMWTFGIESLEGQIHLELVIYQVGKPKLTWTPRRGTDLNARVGSNDVQF